MKSLRYLAVAFGIHVQLTQPEVRVGLGQTGVLFAAMPKAAVDEHRNPLPGEGDVDCPPPVERDAVVDAVPQASFVQDPA